MEKTFKKGIHPPANKWTEDYALKVMSVPDSVSICLSQHIGAPAEAVVAVGDEVKCGTLIGKAQGFVSSNVYSSVSGTVVKLEMRPTALGRMAKHIVIKNDKQYAEEYLPELSNPSKEQIVDRILEAGIVGMGGATFPTHVKLKPSKPVDTLIINGAECEPYITCDYRIMIEYADKFLEGVRVLKKALGVEKAYIGIEKNKPKAIELLTSKAGSDIEVIPLKVKYPQGAEKQLIYAITKRKVPAGGLPMDIGCVVSNVHTAYSIYEAVVENRPCYKRAMTVSGKGVHGIGNFIVRNGVPYSYIYSECQGGEPYFPVVKVVSGGPMMGFSQSQLEATTTKGTSSLLFLTEQEINIAEPSACINCARCASACPMNLMPMFIDTYTRAGDYDLAKKIGVLNCIECGSCAYSCPAKRPLVQTIKLAKQEIKARGI